MDEWIRRGWRTDPHGTIGKLLRLGVIAFENPTETRYTFEMCRERRHHPLAWEPLHHGQCGECIKQKAFRVRRVIAIAQYGPEYDEWLSAQLMRSLSYHYCSGQGFCRLCKRPMPEPLHIPTLDGSIHPGQLPNVLVDLPDA